MARMTRELVHRIQREVARLQDELNCARTTANDTWRQLKTIDEQLPRVP
jgi:hypothetical protein